MDSVEGPLSPFVHDPAYPFLFCTLCKHAVLVPSTSDHLKDLHKDVVPISQRKVVREAACRLHGMYERKEDMTKYSFPNPGDKPIAYLHKPVNDGLRCNECGWITRSVTRMRAHCCKAHGSSSSLRWRTNVSCQQLFAKGPHSGWFEVEREEDVISNELMSWLQSSDGLRMYVRRYCVLTTLRMST